MDVAGHLASRAALVSDSTNSGESRSIVSGVCALALHGTDGTSDAAFASASQLLVLLLLIRQMESTRTPSTLAKVSVWTIVMMGISDSWVFSAHVVLGIVSDNQSSLPLLVPGFLCLCTAIIFAPVGQIRASFTSSS